MKKLLFGFSIVLASLLIISCGGGGGKDDTPGVSGGDGSAPLAYKGAVGKGDYAQVKFDPKSGKMDFNISGQFADTIGVHEGSITLNHIYGNIYRKEDSNSSVGLFVSKSTALALVELKEQNGQNQQFFFGMLENHGTNPTYGDVNGTYNVIIALNNSRLQNLCQITFSSNDKTGHIGPCVTDTDEDDQTYIPFNWDINATTKLIDINNSDGFKAIAVFKKSEKRDALVFDIQHTPDNKSGMAIGLKAKKLESNEITGNTEFKYVDLNYDINEYRIYPEYGKVKISPTSTSNILKIEDSNFNFNTQNYESSETGYVKINPTVYDNTWDGVIRVCKNSDCNTFTNEYAIFSADDGYYFSVDTKRDNNSDEDDFILSLGSNKPVK